MLALLLLQDSSTAASDAAASAFCGGFGLLYFVCVGLLSLVGIFLLVFWIMMLVDCIQRQESEFPNSSGNSKTIWIILLIFFSYLASIIYYFMVKRKAPRGKATSSAPPPTPPAPPV